MPGVTRLILLSCPFPAPDQFLHDRQYRVNTPMRRNTKVEDLAHSSEKPGFLFTDMAAESAQLEKPGFFPD
jgi:hypothetical protein